jgi:hypothetical protein
LVDREESWIAAGRKPLSGNQDIAIFAEIGDYRLRVALRDIGQRKSALPSRRSHLATHSSLCPNPLPAIILQERYGKLKKSSA